MNEQNEQSWCPFRPNAKELKGISEDVSKVRDIQQKLLDNHEDLHLPDRVAHQYQIAGGKVIFKVADTLLQSCRVLVSLNRVQSKSELVGFRQG